MSDLYYSYEYAVSGWDAPTSDFVNFETTFTASPLTSPSRIPRGSVTSKASDGFEVTDGFREIVIAQVGDPYGTSNFADLDTYVNAAHGGWDQGDVEISLRTRDLDGSFIYINAIAHFPAIGTDYTMLTSTEVQDLKLRYTFVNTYMPS